MMLRFRLPVSLLLLLIPLVAGAQFEASKGVSWRGIVIYRDLGGGSRERVIDTNCYGVHACRDTTGGAASIDTTGLCHDCIYEATSKDWRLPTSQLAPLGTTGRYPVSLYLKGAPAQPDTLIRSGFRLDMQRPMIASVDSAGILARNVSAVHVDTTENFIFKRGIFDDLQVRQVPASGVGVDLYNGVFDGTGKALRIGGVSGAGTGRAISIEGWQGAGIYFVKTSGSTANHALNFDMSAETYTGAETWTALFNYAGAGKVHGIQLTRTSGGRAFDNYGLKIGVTSGATQTIGSDYGIYVATNAALSLGARNVGIYTEAETSANSRALLTKGDIQIGSTATPADSLLVFQRSRLFEPVYLADSLFLAADSATVGLHSDGEVIVDDTLRVRAGSVFSGPPGWSGSWCGTASIDSLATTDVLTITGFDSTLHRVMIQPVHKLGGGGADWPDPPTVERRNGYVVVHGPAAAARTYFYDWWVWRRMP